MNNNSIKILWTHSYVVSVGGFGLPWWATSFIFLNSPGSGGRAIEKCSKAGCPSTIWSLSRSENPQQGKFSMCSKKIDRHQMEGGYVHKTEFHLLLFFYLAQSYVFPKKIKNSKNSELIKQLSFHYYQLSVYIWQNGWSIILVRIALFLYLFLNSTTYTA